MYFESFKRFLCFYEYAECVILIEDLKRLYCSNDSNYIRVDSDFDVNSEDGICFAF